MALRLDPWLLAVNCLNNEGSPGVIGLVTAPNCCVSFFFLVETMDHGALLNFKVVLAKTGTSLLTVRTAVFGRSSWSALMRKACRWRPL